MPSVHVAWAVFVGYYAWRVSSSRWRWVAPAHAALMTFVVVATGNHWWLDGIVATLVLVVAAWGVFGVRTGWRALLAHLARPRRGAAGRPPNRNLRCLAEPAHSGCWDHSRVTTACGANGRAAARPAARHAALDHRPGTAPVRARADRMAVAALAVLVDRVPR